LRTRFNTLLALLRHRMYPAAVLFERMYLSLFIVQLTGSIVSSSRKLQMNIHMQHLLIW